MKLICLFMFVALLQVSASSYSQNTKLNVTGQNLTLEKVFELIEDQSEFSFIYNLKQVDLSQTVDVDFKNERVEKILDRILDGTDITYTVNNRLIVVHREGEKDLLGTPAVQQKNISGKVTDESGEPLPGVTVLIKGTTNGTVTNFDGEYTVTNIPEGATLQFSFVGMKSQEIVVGSQTSVDVTLVADAIGIEEVVAVGYGTQKKINLTGALSTVGTEELENAPANSIASLMQGRMPGVTITQNSGQPGREGITIRIRGIGTMNNSDPMVIVDGLETTMDDVNPNDIESITTLKDASAASIYGTRAANGVILITTKRGAEGEPKLNYSGYVGFQSPINMPEHLKSWEYAELLNEGLMNEGKTPQYSDTEIEAFKNGSAPNTNWLDLMLQGSGFTQNHNINVTGGTAKSKYMISLAYYNQDGLLDKTDHDRYTARLNFDSKLYEWMSFGVNSSLSRRKIVQPTNPFDGLSVGQFFRQANRIPATIANKNENGEFIKSHVDGNPVAWIENGGQGVSLYSHAVGSTFLELRMAEGLTLKGLAGMDFILDDGRTHVKSIFYAGGIEQGPNSKEDYLGRQITTTLQATLNYEKKIEDHSFKVLLGTAREEYASHVTRGYRKNFPSNDLTDLNAGSTEGMEANGHSLETSLGSIFGRLNYDFKGKYLFEATVRRDASSKFAPDVRNAIFPSFSAGWRISEEQFLNDLEWLDNFKLRGSWGKLGNHKTESYQYLSTVSTGQGYPFGGVMYDGASQTTPNNPNITWETTTEWDLGFDASVYNGLLSVGFDYYDRLTDDILTRIPVASAYGLSSPLTNIGAMSNKGIELQLGHRNTIRNIDYNFSAYGAYNKNEVVSYPNPFTGEYVFREGDPWGAFYGYECIGKFLTDEEAINSPNRTGQERAGDLKYKDQDNDKKITEKDKVVLGTVQPKFTYGFNFDMTYKQFDLSMFFQGVAGVHRVINHELMWGFTSGASAQEKHLDRTIVENGVVVKEGNYPRILPNDYYINNEMSSFRVMKSDYLRMKNITLGYTLPKSLTKNTIERARVYVSGQNLLTFTNFVKDADPEVRNGEGGNSYPQVKYYTLGVNITF